MVKYPKTIKEESVTIMSEIITETAAPKKRMLSGIKPSGDLTLGSYLGAVKNWAERADSYDCFYFMADMHAITVRQNPADLRRRTLEQLAQYIACGLDPEKNTLFIQSHVHQHAELGWVLNCYAMFGELNRMTQFKDKSAKNADNINGGLFTYPSLMAADILLYQPDLVPVGEDQKQHVELTHAIARRFNGIYGDVFKIPEPFVPKVGARIMSLTNPTAKMSKSENEDTGRVLLMDPPEVIMRQFKRAITDSDTENCVRYDKENKPGVSNLMTIYAAVTGKTFPEIEAEFAGQGYGKFKPAVGEAVVEALRPIREEAARLMKRRVEPDEVENVLNESPCVDRGVVRAFTDEQGLAYLTAYFVPSHKNCRISRIREFLASRLADYMVPEFFVRMDEIPLTVRGKVNDRALPVVMKEGVPE